MGTSELKESLLDQQQNQRTSTNWFSCCVVLTISFSSLVLFACLTWPNIFLASQNIAVKLPDVRVHHYNPQGKGHNSQSSIYYKIQYATDDTASVLKKLSVDENKKLVCYYSSPYNDDTNDLYPKNIDPYLCTHLNVGMVNLVDNQIHIDEKARKLINETLVLRRRNKNLKLILWVGGAASKGFPEMVSNHSTRKIFIRSLRHVLKTYSFDGVDIDWEFPTAFRKERQHFSQLLYEIRKEYEREHRNYLLSIAVAAPEGLAYFAYDIIEINKYVDYVNIMTYDYYFYSKSSPFTGLNSPLYKRQSEHSVLSTLNIDHSVNYWSSKGLNKSKIVVGLPTYGHSFSEFNWIRLCILVAICAAASIIVYSTWSAIYRESLNIPPKYSDIPMRYYNRTEIYSEKFYKRKYPRDKLKLFSKKILYNNGSIAIKQIENERIYPSKYGNFIFKQDTGIKLVCYYEAPTSPTLDYSLHLNHIDAHLCTHLNVGVVNVFKNQLVIDARITNIIIATKELKQKNKNVKVLLWVGGTNTAQGFSKMIAKGNKRKIFIQSLISVLEDYCLDGVDLDWEFPEAFRQEHEHFAQLLHEIRREYQRQHRTYLLSVAVAAPEEIVYFSYDIAEMNSYVDYLNIFSFDYHSYTKQTPFTGINAPLYPRQKYDNLYLKKVNINYTVNMWLSQGLDRRKVIVGLPTFGHSFRLVNPFNHGIGSPAEDFGRVGTLGFASYSEVCWFKQNNIYVTTVYDVETCSPYMYAGVEWISYEDERSIECKARYVKENGFGGVMIFSLNTDDYGSHCQISVNKPAPENNQVNSSFPLVRKIYSVLFDKEN